MIPSIPALQAALSASPCFADACQIVCENVPQVQGRYAAVALLSLLWEEQHGQRRPGSAAHAARETVKVFTHV